MSVYCPHCQSAACTFFPRCHCGCGNSTLIPRNGRPNKYLMGHAGRRFSNEDAREMRRLYLDEGWSYTDLSIQYGNCSIVAIQKIIRLETYKEAGVGTTAPGQMPTPKPARASRKKIAKATSS